jgi:hypothetical protein
MSHEFFRAPEAFQHFLLRTQKVSKQPTPRLRVLKSEQLLVSFPQLISSHEFQTVLLIPCLYSFAMLFFTALLKVQAPN